MLLSTEFNATTKCNEKFELFFSVSAFFESFEVFEEKLVGNQNGLLNSFACQTHDCSLTIWLLLSLSCVLCKRLDIRIRVVTNFKNCSIFTPWLWQSYSCCVKGSIGFVFWNVTLTFQKNLFYLFQWKPFKNDEKCFFISSKKLFSFSRYLNFNLYFLVM